MTNLERMIQEAVDRGLEDAVAKRIDNIADGFVNAMLKDPEIKNKFARLVKKAIDSALKDIDEEA